jgi:hypothetical protein
MPSYAPSTTTLSSIDTLKSGKTTSTVYLVSSASSAKTPSKTQQAWKSVKKHAREHHESVNAAYALYYGQSLARPAVNGKKL